MFQIAIERNTVDEELTPIAVTGSQHWYGQTLLWDVFQTGDKGPGFQDQDYIGRSGYRPNMYVARKSHATYFRPNGEFDTDPGSGNHGHQYLTPPDDTLYPNDVTGNSSYGYSLKIFDLDGTSWMIQGWLGNWGVDPPYWWAPGSPSPAHRHCGSIYMWTNPVGFHNYYLKLKDYDDPEQGYKYEHLEIN